MAAQIAVPHGTPSRTPAEPHAPADNGRRRRPSKGCADWKPRAAPPVSRGRTGPLAPYHRFVEDRGRGPDFQKRGRRGTKQEISAGRMNFNLAARHFARRSVIRSHTMRPFAARHLVWLTILSSVAGLAGCSPRPTARLPSSDSRSPEHRPPRRGSCPSIPA